MSRVKAQVLQCNTETVAKSGQTPQNVCDAVAKEMNAELAFGKFPELEWPLADNKELLLHIRRMARWERTDAIAA